ncbi:protein KHNYN [Electrophorus electricus]|uniref:protein KHNYN n=1 Tax=Electrophorus electricus TaxID=8005 RepID=UPI0015CF9D9A|nr:protein KHNYN [Electrophorus electricus]XP_026852489.2 protein KHNYN [Electrophorus electricus]
MDLSADLGWRDDMRAEQHVEDEFTCPVVLRGSLLAQQSVVERLFGVILRIGEGLSSYTPQDGQIWLQLKGKKTEVEAAKLFVKGVVNQEAQKEVQYPEALHCVFCGAKGLFIDSLIKNTSAHIMVGSMGCLLISGLAEPVVKAYSLIMDLVDKYRDSQAQPYKAACESLESRRVFKSMVERLEDRHTLDLLVLPVLVKELLLDLVKQSALDLDFWDNVSVSAERETLLDLSENIDRLILREPRKNETLSSTILLNPNGTSQNLPISCSYGIKYPRMDEFFSDLEHRPLAQAAEENMQDGNAQKWVGGASLDANKERESLQQDEHLLKFFTAMGYNEEVVGRVLARSGPQEPSQILDLVQQEQSPTVEDGAKGAKEDDFVLGVTKKAAASCGYTEEKVDAVFNNLPKIKPHQLILELQKEGMRKPEGGRLSERKRTEEPEEQQRKVPSSQSVKDGDLMDEKKNERVDKMNEATNMEKAENDEGMNLREKSKKKEREKVGRRGLTDLEPRMQRLFMEQDRLDWASNKPDISSSSPPSVRGPPQPVYASPLHHNNSERQVNPTEAPVTKSKQKQGPPPAKAGAVVTGAQRFLEGLDMPFALQLNDDPGDPELRQIIIDGSNVAKSHGLGMFFSCRGIALAVQYFWSRGHRKITVFVPQWRQKKDPKIKEQHFMTELQDLGLLSFTPSREVLKQRINCYDDRFMLQLAQQTDGVIVTNDNMRDLVDESASWREIIKKRLLQYVFAGDLFMVPDDPLGRSGPHINDFLRMQNSHSFAGMSSSSSPSYHPRAQTEVLQYRERTPGGVHSAHGSGKGQAQAGKEMERTSEATLRLKQDLVQIFPGQESMVTMTLQCHPTVTDINKLSHFILESQGNV